MRHASDRPSARIAVVGAGGAARIILKDPIPKRPRIRPQSRSASSPDVGPRATTRVRSRGSGTWTGRASDRSRDRDRSAPSTCRRTRARGTCAGSTGTLSRRIVPAPGSPGVARRLCAKTSRAGGRRGRPASVGADSPVGRALIADPGEIAPRIVRACRETGMEAVAVRVDGDRDAAQVRAGVRGVRLGRLHRPGAARGSARSWISVASSAEAAHPGGLPFGARGVRPRGGGGRSRLRRSAAGRHRRAPRHGRRPPDRAARAAWCRSDELAAAPRAGF